MEARKDLIPTDAFDIVRFSRAPVPRIALARIKESVLGARFYVSVVFAGDRRMRALNHAYRRSDRATNILSFRLSDTTGELFLSPRMIRAESKRYNIPYPAYFAYIYIHGLLHLKGHSHGSTMKARERRILRRFGFETQSVPF